MVYPILQSAVRLVPMPKPPEHEEDRSDGSMEDTSWKQSCSFEL